MFNQIAIEVVQWERERQIREAIRQRRLLSGDGPDPENGLAAAVTRSRRRERATHPVRLATP
jgi:hypothetical protein